jgi:hypothetical protein
MTATTSGVCGKPAASAAGLGYRRWLARANELDVDELSERLGVDRRRQKPVVERRRLPIPDPRKVVTDVIPCS